MGTYFILFLYSVFALLVEPCAFQLQPYDLYFKGCSSGESSRAEVQNGGRRRGRGGQEPRGRRHLLGDDLRGGQPRNHNQIKVHPRHQADV